MLRIKKQELVDHLDDLKKIFPELENTVFCHPCDLKRHVALSIKRENGEMDIFTDFMPYEQMQVFLKGYMLGRNHGVNYYSNSLSVKDTLKNK